MEKLKFPLGPFFPVLTHLSLTLSCCCPQKRLLRLSIPGVATSGQSAPLSLRHSLTTASDVSAFTHLSTTLVHQIRAAAERTFWMFLHQLLRGIFKQERATLCVCFLKKKQKQTNIQQIARSTMVTFLGGMCASMNLHQGAPLSTLI